MMKHRLSYSFVLGAVAIALCGSAQGGETPCVWEGPSGGSWSDEDNWSCDAANGPCNVGPVTFDVTINGGEGTINHDVAGQCEITSLTLGNSTLVISAGTSLTVLDVAEICGTIDAQGGDFTAAGSGAAFPCDTAKVWASDGSVVTIAAPTYSSAGMPGQATILRAVGEDTSINLSSLTSLSTAWPDNSSTDDGHTITATGGAAIDLSAVTQIEPPQDRDDFVCFTLSDDLSTVNLDALQTISGAGGYTRFLMSNSAAQNLPALTTMEDVRFELSSGAQLHVDGASPASYSSVGMPGERTIMSADGVSADGTTPTLLDLSAVTSLSAAWPENSSTDDGSTITATGGATIDLSAVTQIEPPEDSGDSIEFVAVGSLLELTQAPLTIKSGGGWARFDLSHGAQVPTGILNLQTYAEFTLHDADGADTTLQINGDLNLLGGAAITLDDADTNLHVDGDLLARPQVTTTMTLNDPAAHLEILGTLDLGPDLSSNIHVTAPVGAAVNIGGDFLYSQTDEELVALGAAAVQFDGSGTEQNPQVLEVGGWDVGLATQLIPEDEANFGFGQMVVGQPDQATTVRLQDLSNNNEKCEALYLWRDQRGGSANPALVIHKGSTLIFDEINLYICNGADCDPGGVDWEYINGRFDPPEITEIIYEQGGGTIKMGASPCPSDLDCDGMVGPTDLANLLNEWGPCPAEGDCPADLNFDGTVGPFDLALLLNDWGACE